jgi:hypothetical protein
MIPSIISFRSTLRGHKDLYKYIKIQNRVHIPYRSYWATNEKDRNIEYYEVKTYEKFELFKNQPSRISHAAECPQTARVHST